jgi:mRNA-degrading endonuclease HigB of HigAB toxin-antitoxin module
LVPSSSLGLSIPSDLAMCGVFEFSVILTAASANTYRWVCRNPNRIAITLTWFGRGYRTILDVIISIPHSIARKISNGFYRDAEAVGNFTVFNIKGNKYHLIVSIDYEAQLIYYKYFLTHAEYDQENWKNDDYY